MARPSCLLSVSFLYLLWLSSAARLPDTDFVLGADNPSSLLDEDGPESDGASDVDDCSRWSARLHELHQKTWSMLSREQRHAFEAIGYNEIIWNDYQMKRLENWDDLTDQQRNILSSIGFTKEEWNCFALSKTLYPDELPLVEGKLSVSDAPLAGSQALVFETGSKRVVIGVFPQTFSVIVSSIIGRLLAGMYGLKVEFKSLRSTPQAYDLMDGGKVDLIMDVDRLVTHAPKLRDHIYDYGSLTELGNIDHLYLVKPNDPETPYFNVTSKVVPYWTLLQMESVRQWIPHAPCSMGPWGGNSSSGYGVWCHEQRDYIPVIWAQGPQTPDHEVDPLMAFINAKGLPFGVEFLEYADLDRRVQITVSAGVPALFYVDELSLLTQKSVEGVNVRRVSFPDQRNCGDLGTWADVGKWHCAPIRTVFEKLGSSHIDSSENVRTAVMRFVLRDSHMHTMFETFRKAYDESRDVWNASDAATSKFVASEEKMWRTWFTFPDPMSTRGRSLILCFFGVGFLAFALAELRAAGLLGSAEGADEGQASPLDAVDRRVKPNVGLEVLAGTNSTLGTMMDAVGIAAIVLSTRRLSPYSVEFLKHVLVGQLVCQGFTLLGSKYETPITTASIEALPFLAILVAQVEESTKGRSGECVLATLLVGSMLICFLSGLIMYAMGRLKLGGMLRYLPYSVKTGVMAGMGIVLLAVALELCCDENFLEFKSPAEAVDFFSPTTSMFWLPAFCAAMGIFLIEKFVIESPYTIICFLVLAIGGFHVIRVVAFGSSMEAATKAGWLYEPVPAGEFFSLWRVLRPENICWSALADNLPTILIAALVAPVLNNVSDLAVVKSVLPPKDMGDSDFNEEMLVQGRSHVISALVCGFSSDYGNDDTIVHRMFGGKRRLSMYVHLGTLGLCLACPYISELLIFIPKFANGGPIALAGIEFLHEALVESYGEMKLSEYLVVVTFAVLVLATGGALEQAIIIGTFLGFTDFIVQYANAGQAKFMPAASSTTWPTSDRFRLDFCGLRRTIGAVKLSGFLFFASAAQVVDQLLEKTKELAGSPLPHRKVLVVDWSDVTGIDTGATLEFERLEEELGKAGVAAIFCGVPPAVRVAFDRCGLEFLGVEETAAEHGWEADSEIGEQEKEEDSDDDEPTVCLVPSLEEALTLAEAMQLRGIGPPISREAVLEAVTCCPSGKAFDLQARFWALSRALVGGGSMSQVLRGLVSRGAARLVAFHDEDILALGARLDHFYVLLAGCIVAYTDSQPVAFRHFSVRYVFGEEALTAGGFARVGYRASPACVVLQVAPAVLEQGEQSIIFHAVTEQLIACKSLRDALP